MTVTYSAEVATAKLTTLFKLLFLRWRGSIMKLLWRDIVLFISAYFLIQFFCISACFRIPLLKDDHLSLYRQYIPIVFVLGFFITQVMTRWWDQYMNIPWPYSIAVYVSSTVHGYDEVGRAMRRTIMRYVCLSLTMVFRNLSLRVRKRFPRIADMIAAGLLTECELMIIEKLEAKFPKMGKNWLPIVWAASIVNRARAEGRIRDDFAVMNLIEALNTFRGMCGNLMNYNVICIPLVYLQVVTIATYAYFVVVLLTQPCSLDFPPGVKNTTTPCFFDSRGCKDCTFASWTERFFAQSIYNIILLMLQFIVYMGLLKVAETMLNPFGDDDDDFEVNFLITRNLQMSYLIVDEMHNEHPELLKDQYWDEIPRKLNDKLKVTIKETDPFGDVKIVATPSSTQRVAIVVDPEDSKENISEPAKSYNHLIPNPSVIDRTYQNKPDIKREQSVVNSDIAKQKERSKSMMQRGSVEEDSDSSTKLRRRKPTSSTTKSGILSDSSDDEKNVSILQTLRLGSSLTVKSEDEQEEKDKKKEENQEEKK